MAMLSGPARPLPEDAACRSLPVGDNADGDEADDMGDMGDNEATGTTRRDLITKGAVAGAIVWAAPTVLSMSAASAASGCSGFTLTEDWSAAPAANPPGFTTYNGPITGTPWSGTNIDVMVPNPSWGKPPWVPPADKWVDLVGALPLSGSIQRTVDVPCDGTLDIGFQFGIWYALTPAGSVTVSVLIDGVPQGSVVAPKVPAAPASWSSGGGYPVTAGSHTVQILDIGGGPTPGGESGAGIGVVTITFAP